MPVKILNRRYTNPLELAPNDTTNWLLGNVGEWQQLTLECEFEVAIDFGIQNTVTIQDPNKFILNDGTNWGDYGFYVGAIFDFSFDHLDLNTNTQTNTTWFSIIITQLYGNTIEVEDYDPTTGTQQPFTNGLGYAYGQLAPIRGADYEIRNVRISTDQEMQGIRLDYAHLKNSQVASGSLNNVVDGTKTAFVAEDTNLTATGEKFEINIPVEVDHYLAPFQSGLSVESVFVTYRGQQGFKRFYDIDIVYMISSLGELLNFEDIEAPDELRGANSITDQVLVTGYPVYNNPNVQITNNVRQYAQEGNVGWFNENYNQLPNLFSASPVVYTNDSGTNVSQLDYANPITVTTTVSGTGFVPVAGQTRVQIGFIWNPLDEDYYLRTPYAFHKNRKVNTGGNDVNGWFPVTATPVVQTPFPAFRAGYTNTNVPSPQSANDTQGQLLFDSQDAQMNMSDVIVAINGNDLDISVTFRPDSGFASWMDSIGENERGYALWISVGDQAPDANQSDRVALLLDVNVLDTFIEPIGEYEGLTIDFLDHPKVYTDTPNPCGNQTFVEDDFLAKVSFQEEIDFSIEDTPDIQSITFGFLVQNIATGQQYELDANTADLTQFPDPTQYNFSQSRDFKLGAGNDKNWWKVDYDPTTTIGTREGVLGWYGYKIRWEDWIRRLPPPPQDFYDNTQLQNGLNNDWYHYFDTAGWTFNFFVNITAILNEQTVVYQNLKEIVIKDYDSNDDVDITVNYYRDNNGVKGALLSAGIDPVSGLPLGVIIKNEYVWVDIVYDWVGIAPPPADWANQASVDAGSYGTSCFEVDQGAGQKQFRQLSSIFAPEFDNPVEGIPGATLATVTQVSTTQVVVEARINGNKIIDANRYKISGRIGCK